MKSIDCTLFSGGATGAEEEFGIQAEKKSSGRSLFYF